MLFNYFFCYLDFQMKRKNIIEKEAEEMKINIISD